MSLTETEQLTRDKFIHWVERKLTVASFRAMLESLEFQQYSWTKISNGNKDFSEPQIYILAAHLQTSARHLVSNYGLGRHRIPAARLDAIKSGKILAA